MTVKPDTMKPDYRFFADLTNDLVRTAIREGIQNAQSGRAIDNELLRKKSVELVAQIVEDTMATVVLAAEK